MTNKSSNTRVIIALFTTIIIDAMGIGLIYPILASVFNLKTGGIVPVTMSTGMRDFLYGLTLAVFPFCMFFGAPILGDFSDHVGRKKVLLFCLYGAGCGMALSAVAITIKSVSLLIFSRAFSGLLAGSLAIAQAAIIDISPEERKTVNIGLISLANVMGFVLGPLLGGVLADSSLVSWFGYPVPFYAATLFAFANGTMLLFTFRETFIVQTKKQIQLAKGMIMFAAAFTNRKIRLPAFAYFFMVFGWGIYVQYISLYLVQQFHYSAAQVGHFVAWLAIIMGFSLLVVIRLLVKFLSPTVIALLALLVAAFGTLIVLHGTAEAQWLGVVPIAAAVGLSYASILTLFSNSADRESQGWVMGIATSVVAIASGLAGLSIGPFAGISMHMPFFASMASFSLSFLALCYLQFNFTKTKKPQRGDIN